MKFASNPRYRVALGAAGLAAAGALLFGLGFLLAMSVGDEDDDSAVVGATPTIPHPRPSATFVRAVASPTPTESAAAVVTSVSTPQVVVTRVVVVATATSTPPPDFTKQPSIELLAASPELGTHIELASVDIALDVRYQGGRDSNVLAWELYYCAGPRDCNTYGSRNETAVVPGAAGDARLGGPFPAGGNYLRPIVVCRYTVTLGHYLTPEAQWQTAMSPDPRCQGGDRSASVRVTGVTPELGSVLSRGEFATVYVEYDAYGANQLQVFVRGDGCVVLGARTVDIERDSAGVTTVNVTSSPPGAGTMREVEAVLLDEGGVVKARYGFGGC